MPAGSHAARGIARAAGMILVITVLARVAGFVRYLVFGATVGAGDVGTAYASANMLPTVMFEIVAGGALAGCVIPLVAGLVENDDDTGTRRASQVVSALLGWTLLLTVPIALAVVVAAPALSALILGGDGAGTRAVALGARMLRVFAVQVPLYGVTVLLGAYLQARRRFFWPAVVPLISSCVVMLAYAGYALAAPAVATVATIPALAEAILAGGTTAGVALMALPLIRPAREAGLRLHPTLRLPAGMGRRALALGGAGLGAVAAQQAALALVLVLAMRAGGTGTLPVFQYAQAVYLLPFAVLVVPIATSVFPHLSELRLVGDGDGFARAASASMRVVIGVGALGGAVLFAAAPAIERFFHLLDRSSVIGVGATVAALSLGLAPYAVTHQATRILSAAMRARDALVVGSVGWLTSAALILVVVLPSVTRRTAEAATAFGLCIALGMTVAAVTGLVRTADLLATPTRRSRIGASAVVSALASALAGTTGYLVARGLLAPSSSLGTVVLVGLLAGGVALVIGACLIAVADREVALRLRDVLRRPARRAPSPSSSRSGSGT